MTSQELLAKKTILIVDDEADIRIILRSLLEAQGYSVSEARDGQEALDLIPKMHFDLMILDLTMPRISGEGVLMQLGKDKLQKIPTIILTAKLEKQVVRKECLEGIRFYVMKPFDNNTIRELVRCLLLNPNDVQRESALSDLLH